MAENADDYKQKGNELFASAKYSQAIEEYTKSIENQTDKRQLSICYSNRAFCHIKQENIGLALQDAQLAIKQDNTYIKGYYRCGQSYLMLFKYDESKKMFLKANKISEGKDPDIAQKLKQVKAIIKEREFAKAIEVGEKKKTEIKLDDILVPDSYDGPKLEENEEITSQWCQQLMKYLEQQKKLHKKYVYIILFRIKKILHELPSLVDYQFPNDIELTVCGDTHGQFYDLLNIFKINGMPSQTNPYLFNGDFVDRGSFSVEVILTLFSWVVHNPNCLLLTRGNHETDNMNKMYGFEGEVLAKYDTVVMEYFKDLFNDLPLGYVLNQRVLVNHGGLFNQENVKLDDMRQVQRFQQPPDNGIMCDMLWSDPVKENGRHPSKRGISIGFGPDITNKFLKENNLELIVRSHEMQMEGYDVSHDGKLITVFSAPNYCDQMKNKGAFIRFLGKDMKPKFTQFEAVEHPKIPAMAYAKGFMNLF